MVKTYSMAPGDVLISEGDPSDSIFFLQKGEMNVLVKKNGRNTKVGVVHEGEIVGEMAFVEKKPRAATVVAATPCELVKVSQHSFENSLDDLEPWLHKFILTLMSRIRQQNFK